MKRTLSHKLKSTLTDKNFWLRTLPTPIIMLVIVFSITQYQQRNMPKGEAPPLVLNSQNIDYSKGPTLVYFWASWCSICTTTSSSVSTLAEEGQYQIISVALSSGSDQYLKAYQKEQGYHFKTINDNHGSISKQWGVSVTPSIFFINTEGHITATTTGITSLWGMKYRL